MTISDIQYHGLTTALGLTTATLVTTGRGRVAKVDVIVAGSAVGGVYDVATTGAAAASNELFVIPNTVGQVLIDLPFTAGLVASPGTGQTFNVAYTTIPSTADLS